MNMPAYKDGDITTISGSIVNLLEPDMDTVHIEDLAWSIGRVLRYNGHIRQDWTVAQHCVVMSYAVPEEYALEALMHDLMEGYIGDIIHPVKSLYPDIAKLEEHLLAKLMEKYTPELFDKVCYGEGMEVTYGMSPIVAEFDRKMYEHECFEFGDRPGVYHEEVSKAWDFCIEENVENFHAPWDLWMARFSELTGYERDADKENWTWFRIPSEEMLADMAKEVSESNG
jgi:hypothetical protein